MYRDTRRLTPGDCFDLIEEADTQEVLAARIRPCDEPHQAEVFGVVEHEAGPDDRFPGEDKLGRDAEDACFDEFSDYVGLSYDFSTLDAAYLMPRPESWAIGDRRITCYVIASPSAPFVESVKDSGE